MFSKKDRFDKFRNELERLMKKCQLTPYGLAQVSRLDPSFVYRILAAKRNPSRPTVLALAAGLLEYSPVVTERDIQLLIKYSKYAPPHPKAFEEVRKSLSRDRTSF